MAKRFTDLNELTAPASDDQLAIVDTSQNETKRITLLNMLSNFIDAVHLKANSVITSKILDGAVTPAKLAPQEAWINMTLQNTWTNYYQPVTAEFGAARYFKDSLGIVHLEGLVKNGTGTITNLPAGYRPGYDLHFAVVANGAYGQVRVNANGNVVHQAGNSAYVALDAISFRQVQ